MEQPVLPTRVLELTGSKKVRLHITDPDRPNHYRYVCLSHCWGNVATVRTTTETIEQYCSLIPWNTLPRTFKDALYLTSHLGLRYLWIDSLCIVQDDADDWRHEGSKMASVYENSFITIAATSSTNPHGGLFNKKSTYGIGQHIDVEEGDLAYNLRVRRVKNTGGDNSGSFSRVISSMPLLGRAWFFQERLLSPRVVHFGVEEMWWECSSIITCECIRAPHVCESGEQHLRTPRVSYRHYYDDPVLAWHMIVSEYTKLALTYETDIFPALQGIACSRGNGEYLAGLWRTSFLQDLLWYYADFIFEIGDVSRQSSSSNSTEAQVYLAPSWSWASRIGRVKWREVDQNYDNLVDWFTARTTPIADGASEFGEIRAGKMELRALCLDVELSDLNEIGSHWTPDDNMAAYQNIVLVRIFGSHREGLETHQCYPAPQDICLAVEARRGRFNYRRVGLARLDSSNGLFWRMEGLGNMRIIEIV